MEHKCKFCKKLFTDRHKRVYCSYLCKWYFKSSSDYYKTEKIINSLGHDWIVWFTGFWEGEGSLSKNYNKKSKNFHYIFSISQQGEITEKFNKYFKFGKINRSHEYNKYKLLTTPCYQWMFGGVGHILAFIVAMMPYIKLEKRKLQINKFLDNKYVKEVIQCLKKSLELY